MPCIQYRLPLKRLSGILQVPLAFFLLTLTYSAIGASILQINSNELVVEAEVIFQGQVVDRESQVAENGMIYTYVDFSVVEVLKGSIKGNSLRLRFDGGTVGETRLNVGSVIPPAGEQGIYFVESVTQHYINPLLGWSQGHFVVNEDNEVVAADGRVVIEVTERDSDGVQRLSNGVAPGFETRRLEGSRQAVLRALSPEEFKARIRAILAEENK